MMAINFVTYELFDPEQNLVLSTLEILEGQERKLAKWLREEGHTVEEGPGQELPKVNDGALVVRQKSAENAAPDQSIPLGMLLEAIEKRGEDLLDELRKIIELCRMNGISDEELSARLEPCGYLFLVYKSAESLAAVAG